MHQQERNLPLTRLQVRSGESVRFDRLVGNTGKNQRLVHWLQNTPSLLP